MTDVSEGYFPEPFADSAPIGHRFILNSLRTTIHPDAAIPSRDDSREAEKRPVVLIAETLGRDRGGAEIYLTRLVDLLAKNNHPVEVYVRRPWLDAVDSNVRVQVVPTMRRFRIVWERRFASRIARRMSGSREVILSTLPLPGITHYQPHSGLYRNNFEAIHQSMEPGLSRAIYGWGNGLNLRRHSLLKMQEQLLTRAHPPQIMTFSRTFRTQLLNAYPNLASSIVTVPLGVDLERFHPGKEAGYLVVSRAKAGPTGVALRRPQLPSQGLAHPSTFYARGRASGARRQVARGRQQAG